MMLKSSARFLVLMCCGVVSFQTQQYHQFFYTNFPGPTDKVIGCFIDPMKPQSYKDKTLAFTMANMTKYELCTHIVYVSASVKAYSFQVETRYIGEEHKWDAFFDLRNKTEGKMLMSISNLEKPEIFHRIGETDEGIKKFAKNVVKFARKKKLDGINLNWSNCKSDEKGTLNSILKALKEEFEKKELILTTMINGQHGALKERYDIKTIGETVDLIWLIAYDYNGPYNQYTYPHAPLFYSASYEDTIDSSVSYMAQFVGKDKIVLGMSCHGKMYSFSNARLSREEDPFNKYCYKEGPESPILKTKDYIGFNEICRLVEQRKYEMRWLYNYELPYAIKDRLHIIQFDNFKSAIIKVDYVMDNDLAGVMIDNLQADDFSGNECDESMAGFYQNLPFPILHNIYYRIKRKEEAQK